MNHEKYMSDQKKRIIRMVNREQWMAGDQWMDEISFVKKSCFAWIDVATNLKKSNICKDLRTKKKIFSTEFFFKVN